MMADLSATLLLFALFMYLALDGTDLGVGMLFSVFPDAQVRKWMAHTLLPVWDANETWLVLLAGGMLALFPPLYSEVLQRLMVPLFLFLLLLFTRALALSYRAQVAEHGQRWLDRLFMLSSLGAAFLPGWLAGQILVSRPPAGIVLDASLVPVLCGAGLVALDLLMGCCWICWRIGEPIVERARLIAGFWWVVMIVCLLGVILLEPTLWRISAQRWPGIIALCAVTGLLLVQGIALWREKMVMALMLTLALMGSVIAALAVGLYPWLLPEQLAIDAAASNPVSQRVVILAMLILLPLIIIYHTWSFWVFKRKE